MVEHLEKARIYLSDEEHEARIDKCFEGSYIILASHKKVGLLKCIETKAEIEILQLQVLPGYQGKGIGKQILKGVISKAEAENKNLRLNVLKENPARHLYERNGFKIVGEDPFEFYMKLVKE